MDWLRDRLSAIRVSETGEKLIERIIVVDEELPGRRRHFLPDLIIEWAPDAPVSRISSPDIGEIEVSLATGRGGNHTAAAFAIAKGDRAFLDSVGAISDIADLGAAAERLLLRQATAAAA